MQVQRQNEKVRNVSKGRLHLITSCTECHKRKQKVSATNNSHVDTAPADIPVLPASIPEIIASQRQRLNILQPQPQHGQSTKRFAGICKSGSGEDESSRTLLEGSLVISQPSQGHPSEVLRRPPNDDFLEPLDVTDAGVAYQRLLTLMLSAPFTPQLTSPELKEDHLQGSEYGLGDDFKHSTEKLKWELWQTTNGRIPRTCFGISSVEPLHYLPIKPTVLNAELLQIFVKVLTKFVVSIDGNPSPNFYNDDWVPWSIKTPLLAQIAIYTASCYQSEARKIPAGKSPIALRHKLKSISLLNETLRDPEQSTCDEAIASVVYLTTNEWYWGFKQNIQAHLSGLREMVRLRGGIGALDNVFLQKTTLLCDYHIACSFDNDPIFSSTTSSLAGCSASCAYPLTMSTPFLQSERNFSDHSKVLSISTETAIILDDMRFLLQAVISQINRDRHPDSGSFESNDEEKLISTSTWVRDRIACLIGAADDFIYQSVRKAALIYCKSIVERTSLSHACTLQDLNGLWVNMWRIPLSRWKKTPGIFIFILLSANQAAQDTAHGRFLKSMLKSASFYVALDNWEVIDGTLGVFVMLQRWLRERAGH